jgi:hypothetical protein
VDAGEGQMGPVLSPSVLTIVGFRVSMNHHETALSDGTAPARNP